MAEKDRSQDLFIQGIPARHVRLFGQNDEPVKVDSRSEALVLIDTVHSRIHEGRFYTTNASDLALADNASITVLVRIGYGQSAHVRPLGICGGDAELFVFEGPTVTNDGTVQAVTNKNRFSPRVAVTEIFLGPTISDDGLELDNRLIIGGSGFISTPGGQSDFSEGEWVFKTNTDYLIRLTNRAGTTQPAQLEIDFYESS